MSPLKRTLIASAVLIASSTILYSFDWPQTEIMSDSFFSYFGQLRGGTISSSLVFGEPAEVKSADSGRLTVIIEEHDSANWFDSTLGNAVILAHNDNMITVYGNIDSEGAPADLDTKTDIPIGTFLGNSGNSAWQNGQSCLEFQVSDTKNRAAINPRVLMPRIGKELELNVTGLSAISKTGELIDFNTRRSLPSGTYLLYRDRQEIAMPYKANVFINGTLVESISYDSLRQSDGRLCLSGKRLYTVKEAYPTEKKHGLGEITLPKGHNTVSVVVSDILGHEESITYNLDAY